MVLAGDESSADRDVKGCEIPLKLLFRFTIGDSLSV